MLQALRPVPMAYWLTSVCYITSSKAYLQEERRLKQIGHLYICLCLLSLTFTPMSKFQLNLSE